VQSVKHAYDESETDAWREFLATRRTELPHQSVG